MSYSRILLFVFLSISFFPDQLYSQKKYQSLMWKISGNGLTKPSYLYGTMHVSGKMVFHLGDHFYDAMESVDIVALELEPEAWLKSIFDDRTSGWYSRSNNDWDDDYNYGGGDNYLPQLKEVFELNTDIQDKVKNALMYDPSVLNYMLFRYSNYGFSADYEEDTWLDMYLYQIGKKMGKQTFGLETYEQSSAFLEKARKEERKDKKRKSYDSRDREEIEKLQNQMEPAYRRQDLDLIDSLNKKTVSPSFDKYILIERNKVFVHNMDSLLQSGKSLLAGMGCAHLPGDSGVVEMLRRIGYTVEYYNKGERNAQRRNKLEKIVYKRPYKSFTTADKQITFDAPSDVYPLFTSLDQTAWISLDIPNGSSFIAYRLKTFAGLKKLDNNGIFNTIDSILYEAVAGNIVSQKKTTVQGYPALDIVNVSRRGDYQRKMIVLLPEEILVLKLTTTGEKVKSGYGNEFFKSIKFNLPKSAESTEWLSQDGKVKISMPGYVSFYQKEMTEQTEPGFLVTSFDATSNDYFMAQRHTSYDPEFIDEDNYELNRLADAYAKDNALKEVYRTQSTYNNYEVVKAGFTNANGRKVHSMFLLQNLNYHVFSAVTEDSLRAVKFFNSIELLNPMYDTFEAHTDTSLYFTVELPYKPEKKKADEDYNDWYSFSDDQNENPFKGQTKSTFLSPPGSSEIIYVKYQRYHKFSDSDGKETYLKYREESILEDGSYKLDRKTILDDEEQLSLELQLSDTGSTRKILCKQILYNKSLYTLWTSYDSISGPGAFITRAYETFTPIDTNFAYSHFINMDNAYLDAMLSADSTTRENAVNMISDMDFEQESASRIRNILTTLPPQKTPKQYDNIKKTLTQGLASDSSETNLNFLRDQFYLNSDSTEYQITLLRTLLRIKTKQSVLTYKKLVLDDPPISRSRNGNGTFDLLYDSLKLAASLMPEIQQTVALNEYEIPTYALMATLLDSGLVKPSSFEKQIDLILLEAKNEFKRLNASDEDGYGFNTAAMINYCTLLHPYRTRQDIDAFFKKLYRTRKTRLLLDIAEFEINHKQTVHDSVITKITANPERVIPLYQIMYKNKIAGGFPEKYKTRDDLVKLYIQTKFSNKNDLEYKVDTVNIFKVQEQKIKGQLLDVYYCKYRQKKSDQWKGVILAFDKTNSTNLWPRYLERSKTIVIDPHENEVEELDREYKLLVEQNRKEFDWNDGVKLGKYSWN